ncbi:MAG: DUF3987 domain-containing protein, partial [Petrotogales bacterium]
HNEGDEEEKPLTDAPDVFLESSAIMALATATQRKFWMSYGASILFPNLWCLLVGKSSFYRKSTAMKLGLNLLEEVDSDLVYPTEFSIEELLARISAHPQGIFHIDEFEAFYKQFARSYMSSGVSLLTSLYDRNTRFIRALREQEFIIDKPMINMIAGTVVESFESTIAQHDVDAGFLPRFFYAVATKKEKNIILPGISNTQKEQALILHLKDIANSPPKELFLGRDASKEYGLFYRDVFSKYKTEMNSSLSPFITRLLTSCIKFSMVFHLAKTLDEEIEKEPMEEAVEFTSRCIKSAKKLFSGVAFSPYQRRRREVLSVIGSSGDWVTRSKLMRALRYPKNLLSEALTGLLEEGTIEYRTVTPPGAKKSATEYKMTEEGIEWELM